VEFNFIQPEANPFLFGQMQNSCIIESHSLNILTNDMFCYLDYKARIANKSSSTIESTFLLPISNVFSLFSFKFKYNFGPEIAISCSKNEFDDVVFDDAVANGETAIFLTQSLDNHYLLHIGNLNPNGIIEIRSEFNGFLKHDIRGFHLMIPALFDTDLPPMNLCIKSSFNYNVQTLCHAPSNSFQHLSQNSFQLNMIRKVNDPIYVMFKEDITYPIVYQLENQKFAYLSYPYPFNGAPINNPLIFMVEFKFNQKDRVLQIIHGILGFLSENPQCKFNFYFYGESSHLLYPDRFSMIGDSTIFDLEGSIKNLINNTVRSSLVDSINQCVNVLKNTNCFSFVVISDQTEEYPTQCQNKTYIIDLAGYGDIPLGLTLNEYSMLFDLQNLSIKNAISSLFFHPHELQLKVSIYTDKRENIDQLTFDFRSCLYIIHDERSSHKVNGFFVSYMDKMNSAMVNQISSFYIDEIDTSLPVIWTCNSGQTTENEQYVDITNTIRDFVI